jgi:hypothetical protein
VALTPLDTASVAGKVEAPSGPTFLISPRANNSVIAVNRILKQGGEVARTREALSAGGETFPPGTFVVSRGLSPQAAAALAKDTGLTIVGTATPVGAKTIALRAPRVALCKSWTAQMDEEWTRFLFEQFEFPFTSVQDADIRAGNLETRYDVLVIPSMSTDAVVDGLKVGTVPPQYSGGVTANGVRNIKTFVEAGGTLVVLNQATLFGLDRLGLPVVDALKDVKPPDRRDGNEAKVVEFACPGSVLRMKFDVTHPVAYGMPAEAPGMFISSPAFRLTPSFGDGRAPPIATYPGEGILTSGYLKGEKYLKNTVAAAEVLLGKGRVILLGFVVEQRGQPHGTFKLPFNALYYGAAR